MKYMRKYSKNTSQDSSLSLSIGLSCWQKVHKLTLFEAKTCLNLASCNKRKLEHF